ncbi:hypothetical protein Dsin_003186 [Dipteronia sinensis]|uniref:Receptor-like serine/threonine-protein kinase n=1 Tax=Dipteronia sinensis TaxID=43782 RepID=A0AAE0B8N7_9ROSI|nr:hypothetical protein Dsin_003186 [Dipteronia sinensis]
MANRDMPVNGKGSKLSLLKNGDLSLTDAAGIHIWNSNSFSGISQPSQLVLSDTGNLILSTLENVSRLLWQSFDSPTDTLLPEQPFANSSTQLVSSRSQENCSSGFYKFYFDDDNVLRLLYTGPLISSVYWPLLWKGIDLWDLGRTTYNNSRIAVFDTSGFFKSSDNYTFKTSDFGAGPQRRLTLDYDGNLRMYSLVETTRKWVVSWQLETKPCRIHGVCGPNSLCKYYPYNGRTCSCLPGFKIKNHTDWSYGCELESEINCNRTRVDFLPIPNVDFYGYDIRYIWNSTISQCEMECMKLCNCKGFMLRPAEWKGVHECFPKFLLINGHRSPEFNGIFYIKLPIETMSSFSNNNKTQNVSILDCSGLGPVVLDRMYEKNSENESLIRILLWFATGFGCFEATCILMVLYYLYSTNQGADNTTQGYILAATGFKRFTYGELKKVTHGFSEEIGRGAGGIVYKGTLSDGRVAAIKQLNEANQGEAEFLAEISSIGKLNHMNLIKMWGYCVEGKHRLLVYEHMKRGSLAENLSSNQLQWDTRFEIAIGTAKGLAYLHEECLEWILHCDIKPKNILLDSDYQPKVADFGLSKLLNRGGGGLNNSSFSRVRGTRGYMAPEWVYNLPITAKVDVYSYGMVVLEMITGKSQTGTLSFDHGGLTSHGRLVTWVKEKMNKAAATRDHSWVEEIFDPSLGCEYDINKLEVFVRVALLCLEEDKDSRPTMRQVVEMLASLQ